MMSLSAPSIPRRMGDDCSAPLRLRVIKTALWLLETNSRATSFVILLGMRLVCPIREDMLTFRGVPLGETDLLASAISQPRVGIPALDIPFCVFVTQETRDEHERLTRCLPP